MQRVKRSTAVAVLPSRPAGGTPGYFAQPNPLGGVPATVPGFEWYNDVQEEIMGVIEGQGMAASDTDHTQLRQAIAKMIQAGQRSVIINNAAFAPAVTGTGKAVYWDSANSRFDLALADGSAKQNCVGFADVANGNVYAFGDAVLFAGLTPGARYYLDPATAGAITSAVPNGGVVFIGIARSATEVFIDIDSSVNTYPVVGSVRNAKMLVSAASATATLTADEVIVETALGGAAYKIPSFNKTINLATSGAGGMDTGAAPTSGYVALYAIYNPITGTSALLAVNSTSAAAPNVYGGANMPAGYAASALLSVWPTNASSQFQVGFQRDRKIWRSSVQVMNGGAATAWTAISLTPAVPPNALSISGSMHNITNTSGGGPIMLAGDTSGTGQQQVGGGGVTNSGFLGSFSDVPIIAQQTTYYQTLSTITSDVNVTAYTF